MCCGTEFFSMPLENAKEISQEILQRSSEVGIATPYPRRQKNNNEPEVILTKITSSFTFYEENSTGSIACANDAIDEHSN